MAPYPVSALPGIQITGDAATEHRAGWMPGLVRCLTEHLGYELHVITYSEVVPKNQFLVIGNTRYHVLKLPRMRYRLFSLFSLDLELFRTRLSEINPDLVHGFGTESIYGFAAAKSGFPFVITIQGILSKIASAVPPTSLVDLSVNRVLLFLESYTIRKGRFFIANTSFAKEYVETLNSQATVFDIANPVDSEYFSSTTPIYRCSHTIVFVGTICKLKGIEELLLAFSRILERFQHVELRLIGYGDPRYLAGRIHPLIKTLKLGNSVSLCGKKDPSEIVAALKAAVCLVLPSYSEQAPQVIAEAMSLGVPVVASDVGGIPSMVEDGITGFLCKPGDVGSLERRLVDLLQNPEMRMQMGARAQAVAKARHDEKSIASQLAIAYGQVLGGVV